MLPDFPKIKNELNRQLFRQFEMLVDKKAPLVSRIKRIGQAEGDKFTFEDEGGQIQEKNFVPFSGKIEIPHKALLRDVNQTVAEQLEQAAESIAAQSEGLLFTVHTEASESVGNVLDARGQQYSPAMMLEMLDKIHIDFDHNGQPELPTVVVHPDTLEKVRHQFENWESDPVLKRRRSEILARKKEEWRVRENNRKLVG